MRLVVRSLLFVSVGLSACGTPKPLTGEQIAKGLEVRDSAFDARVTVVGPEQAVYIPRGLLNDHVRWRVRAFFDKRTGATVYQLYTNVWHQDSRARRYTSASLLGGEQLPTTRISYTPRCSAGGGYVSCTHDETFGVDIPAAHWKGAVASGLPVRFNAQSGDQTQITVSQTYATEIERKVAALAKSSP